MVQPVQRLGLLKGFSSRILPFRQETSELFGKGTVFSKLDENRLVQQKLNVFCVIVGSWRIVAIPAGFFAALWFTRVDPFQDT